MVFDFFPYIHICRNTYLNLYVVNADTVRDSIILVGTWFFSNTLSLSSFSTEEGIVG